MNVSSGSNGSKDGSHGSHVNHVRRFVAGGETYAYHSLLSLVNGDRAKLARLPYSIRVLAENLLRKRDGTFVTDSDVDTVAHWRPRYDVPPELPFHPARVLMQDFTGVPAVVDLAAMRDAVRELGGDPSAVNPRVPVELVADHSVQLDYSGTKESLGGNVAKEYERNGERYSLLKWAQKSFSNFRVVPPNSGICHQVNLEYLGRVTVAETANGETFAYPDTVVGLDSHTPMINAVGVLGWGVGGIEAEAVMLGQPYYLSVPEVVGVRLTGRLSGGVTATDLVLALTELLRKRKVVEKFVEYFGPGMKTLSVPDRATVSNMTPEYGATVGFFPIDGITIDYLRLTGRAEAAELTEAYARANGFFFDESERREYTEVIDFDLGSVERSLAGPKRPQDRVPLSSLRGTVPEARVASGTEDARGAGAGLVNGSVVIAAITSCTNTSNPGVLIGAGLMAREAAKRGLAVPDYVKTSFAPGSRVVTRYLEKCGLLPAFEALGFHVAAYGCTTCIGNSGPLRADIEREIKERDLNVAAVLSGNRNFEARVHQLTRLNYLASPPLVVAFALAGRVDIDLSTEPLGTGSDGAEVYLKDLWPDEREIASLAEGCVATEFFTDEYARIFEGDSYWKALETADGATYDWDGSSTYVKKPPYFENFSPTPPDSGDTGDIEGARIFLVLGDSVTTDHISPAGAIEREYPAGRYLASLGVSEADFNSYGSRRGNHEVMARGTFGNIRMRNRMIAPAEGAFTVKHPEGVTLYNYEAAARYASEGVPLVVLAGKEYGSGSSRDWAAKGTRLFNIRAVIAESFERIHRNNLVGMGVLPLVFAEGENAGTLGLDGSETLSILGLSGMRPRKKLEVRAAKADGRTVRFAVTARLDTEVDVLYYAHGGILPYVLRRILASDL